MPKATPITWARHAPAEMSSLGSGEVPARGPLTRAVMAVGGGQLSEEYDLGLHLSPSAFFLFVSAFLWEASALRASISSA